MDISPLLYCSDQDYASRMADGATVDTTPLRDEERALVGYGGSFATTTGIGTGLGTYQLKGVSLQTFGPQLSPLGDCSAFGIAQPTCLHKPQLELRDNGFYLKGVTRLHRNPYIAHWIEVTQELEDERLELELRPLKPIEGWWTFYWLCEEVQIGDRKLHPRSLDSYRGEKGPIKIGKLTVRSPGAGSMEVIPLPGGDTFWGATFLVAYPLQHLKMSLS